MAERSARRRRHVKPAAAEGGGPRRARLYGSMAPGDNETCDAAAARNTDPADHLSWRIRKFSHKWSGAGSCKRRSKNPSLEATEWVGCAGVKIRQSESLCLILARARDEGRGTLREGTSCRSDRGSEQAGSCRAVLDRSDNRRQDVGILDTAWLPAVEASGEAEAGPVHRNYRCDPGRRRKSVNGGQNPRKDGAAKKVGMALARTSATPFRQTHGSQMAGWRAQSRPLAAEGGGRRPACVSDISDSSGVKVPRAT